MKIITRDFGEQEVDESRIITFPEGIIGFEDKKKYALLSPLGDEKFPMWLQAVDSKEPCFVVYDPMEIYSGYRFEISDEEQATLRIDEDSPYRCLAGCDRPGGLPQDDHQSPLPHRRQYEGAHCGSGHSDGAL